MRLPVFPPLSTKDGTSNRNARLTNCLKESKKTGDKAVIRPGLVLDAQASGVGNGLVSFNGELVSVYGTTLGLNTAAASSSLTLITDTIDSFVAIQSVRYMTGTEWLIGGINTDTEEGELYVLDTSDDSTTRVAIGLAVYDIMAIASSGTTVAVASRPDSFGGGADPGLFVSSVSSISFVEKTSVGDDPYSVKYAGGRYVSVLVSGKVMWSTDDGATWSSYSLPSNHGRDCLYDGLSWWFFGGDGLTAPWAYKTTDFVTFSVQSLTGLGALEPITSCAYADGTYYLIGASLSLKASSDGLAWSEIAASGIQVIEASDGNVYVGKSTPDTLYRLDGTTLTTINATAFSGVHAGTDALPDSSVLISATNSSSVARVVPAGDDTIPSIATVTGTQFDFAQSPL